MPYSSNEKKLNLDQHFSFSFFLMSLFVQQAPKPQSLALKYRPQSLKTFFGQNHLLAPGAPLQKLLEQGSFINAIFRGKPWTGKTSLAQIIAKKLNYYYEYLNATKASTADIKKLAQQAQKRRELEGSQTLLFLDEIHRFNKLQQDSLLEDLEIGNLLLIGATTENPYYQLNNALLSRCIAFEFQPLGTEELVDLMTFVLQGERLQIDTQILSFLAERSEWDARSALNKLELLCKIGGNLTLEEVKTLIPSFKSYHKVEDKYDTISAMIKSIRGSDPDAAVYRLAKMLSWGEDPEYIARRLVILAAEDIGLANPQALPIATAGMQAAKELGMPEIRIPLAEVAIYLALSPKSNSAYNAINAALEKIKKDGIQTVPQHLTQLGSWSYQYPHDHPQHRVQQTYLEKPLQLYIPCENKFETAAQERLKKIKNSR